MLQMHTGHNIHCSLLLFNFNQNYNLTTHCATASVNPDMVHLKDVFFQLFHFKGTNNERYSVSKHTHDHNQTWHTPLPQGLFTAASSRVTATIWEISCMLHPQCSPLQMTQRVKRNQLHHLIMQPCWVHNPKLHEVISLPKSLQHCAQRA
jgi:hypothetical protein